MAGTARDAMQVCKNGHLITGRYHTAPESQKRYCRECGESTIAACPNCGTMIEGDLLSSRVFSPSTQDDVPCFCESCGAPFPWTMNRVRLVVEEDTSLSDEEKTTLVRSVEKIAMTRDESDPNVANQAQGLYSKLGAKVKTTLYTLTIDCFSETVAKIVRGY